jgi:hypothetical protein
MLLIGYMRISLLFFTTICSCASIAQINYPVVDKIQFKSLTRGAFEEILITKDSILLTKKELSDKEEIRISRKLDNGEWDNLMKSLRDVPLAEINTYTSPTNKRNFDGARHSSIIIIQNDVLYQHTFDNRHPYIKLKPLMEVIDKIAYKGMSVGE